jgi:hypothetical protein
VQEVVDACVAADLGIVQMPCPEQRAWGGVAKRYLLWTLAMRERSPFWFRWRRLILPLFMRYTRLVYRHLATRVAREAADYTRAGYRVVAVVGVDGSPSCRVDHRLDARTAVECLGEIPSTRIGVDEVNRCVRRALMPGRGLFTVQLQRALERHGVAVPFLAHDLIAELDGGERSKAWQARLISEGGSPAARRD